MKPAIKQLWIDALRSGDYRQGRGCLSADGKFCCLGVLTDLAVKAGVVQIFDEDQIGRVSYRSIGSNDVPEVGIYAIMPAVAEWAGIEAGDEFPVMPLPRPFETPRMDADGFGVSVIRKSLVQLNDGARYDFNQIADVIEEQF